MSLTSMFCKIFFLPQTLDWGYLFLYYPENKIVGQHLQRVILDTDSKMSDLNLAF